MLLVFSRLSHSISEFPLEHSRPSQLWLLNRCWQWTRKAIPCLVAHTGLTFIIMVHSLFSSWSSRFKCNLCLCEASKPGKPPRATIWRGKMCQNGFLNFFSGLAFFFGCKNRLSELQKSNKTKTDLIKHARLCALIDNIFSFLKRPRPFYPVFRGIYVNFLEGSMRPFVRSS